MLLFYMNLLCITIHVEFVVIYYFMSYYWYIQFCSLKTTKMHVSNL